VVALNKMNINAAHVWPRNYIHCMYILHILRFLE